MAAMVVAIGVIVSDKFFGPLCQVEVWFSAIGVQLIYSTLFMRLLRIYSLFVKFEKVAWGHLVRSRFGCFEFHTCISHDHLRNIVECTISTFYRL